MNYPFLINLTALILLLMLSVIMSVIWHGHNSPYLMHTIMSEFITIPDAASTMSSPPAPYYFFGRFTLVFYMVIYLNINKIKTSVNFPSQYISKLLLAGAMLGDIGTYWLSEAFGANFRMISFWYIELPFLLLLLSFWLGLASYQSKVRAKAHGMLWLLPLLLLTVGLIQYLPHSLLLVLLSAVTFKCFNPS